ncbi:MAG: diguanylate cyclase [Negativicutes bacterium]|nr:diguanylate cyclase [Negativicutes bacterium]
MAVLLAGIYYLSLVREKYDLSIYLALLLTSTVIPFIWFQNGGINGNVPFYLMLFAPMGAILLEGYKRFILTAIIALLTIMLIGTEYLYPYLVVDHPSQTAKYIDVSIALLTSVVVNSLLLTLILKNYDEQHQRAKKFLAESETARSHLQFLSFHDSLTGLYNRTFFETELKRLESAKVFNVAVFVLDLDGLKFVNDTLGHFQGDQVIIRAAKVLQLSFPDNSPIFRTGGDEFIVILREIYYEELELYYRRIQQYIQKDNQVTNSTSVPLRISVGYAWAGDSSKSLQDLAVEAENKMYREKMLHHATSNRSMVQTIREMLSARDYNTGNHSDRLEKIVVALAKAAGVPDSSMSDLQFFAKFHDIGKIGISDHILFKSGSLTKAEKREVQRHSEIGYRIACAASDLSPIADWILRHHEWWNGKGYPLGLKGTDIPFECRLLAIANSYDAITSDRPYRKAMDYNEAIGELKRGSGVQFDPELLQIFLSMESTLRDEDKQVI